MRMREIRRERDYERYRVCGRDASSESSLPSTYLSTSHRRSLKPNPQSQGEKTSHNLSGVVGRFLSQFSSAWHIRRVLRSRGFVRHCSC